MERFLDAVRGFGDTVAKTVGINVGYACARRIVVFGLVVLAVFACSLSLVAIESAMMVDKAESSEID